MAVISLLTVPTCSALIYLYIACLFFCPSVVFVILNVLVDAIRIPTLLGRAGPALNNSINIGVTRKFQFIRTKGKKAKFV